MILKRAAIGYQVAAEARERENALMLKQLTEWLHLEHVDAALRDHFLKRVAETCDEANKAHRRVKELMDDGAKIL